jgi:hypothetical protein
MRALVHVGLAALLVIAPALCCCNLHYLTGRAVAAPCPSCTHPAEAVTPSCCRHEAPPESVTKSCCHEADAPESTPAPQPKPHAPECKCAAERADAAPPQAAPEIAAPEPAGEVLLLAVLFQAAVPPEHLGLIGGLDPPERAGVDCKSEALFARHVMRC